MFAPVAFAGAPDEDRHNDIPPMILDRSVIIELDRKLPDEVVKDFDSIVVEERCNAMHDRIARWSASVGDIHILPQVPEGIRDRARDIWRPLLQIAELAGAHDEPWSGAWPQAARLNCETKCAKQKVDDDESSLGKRLLRDIRAVFEKDGRETSSGDAYLKSTELVDLLIFNEEWEWDAKEYGQPVMNAIKLARYLKIFGIKSRTLARSDDAGDKRPKVYYQSQFEGSWERYLSGDSGEDEDEEDD